ncbi:MAG: hypothetical protein R6U17_00615 [Thermoplasmata archaeon]
MTSELKDVVTLLDWEDRMNRFQEKEEKSGGLYIIAFLLGTLFGMVLIELIMPNLINYGMQVFP